MRILCEEARAMKLLPYSVRENLPILGSQQHLGGNAKAWAKCATIDRSCAYYITEGSARRNPAGEAVDYLLFGLVIDQGRRLDYFWLSDLATFRSPAGLPLVRDCCWKPRLLEEVAPELFQLQEQDSVR